MNPQITQLIFLYLIPILFTIVGMGVLLVWVWVGPEIRTLIKKKLGFMKNFTLSFVAYDDRYVTLKAMRVTPEGTIQDKKLCFALPQPRADTGNDEEDYLSEIRDRVVLPSYNFAGMPVWFAHVAQGICTNPLVLTAFKVATLSKMKAKDKAKDKVEATVSLPKPEMVEERIEDINGESRIIQVLKKAVNVTLLIPFDFVDIKKNFAKSWSQARLMTLMKRSELIGQKKTGKDSKPFLIGLIIVTCVCIASMVLIYLLTGGVI